MMRKELLVSGGMASILTAVTGIVLYLNGGDIGDPTTNIPPPDTTAAEAPKAEPSVPGWPAGTTTSTGATNAAPNTTASTPAVAPQKPFPDISAPSSSPWGKSAPSEGEAKPATTETAKDSSRPFGANEAAEAASQFSSRFKSDVAVAEKAVEKKVDDAIPTAGPELALPSANPSTQPNPIANVPMTSTTTAPAAASENRNPIFGTPITAAPVATQPAASQGTPPATQPSGVSATPSLQPAAPPGNAYATSTPTRGPTSEDLQWRPQDLSSSPPRAAHDVTENPLRSPASTTTSSGPVAPTATASNASQPMTLPTLPRRDAPGAKADTPKTDAVTQTPPRQPVEAQPAPRQPVQVASAIPVSTPPRVTPIPGGQRTQQLGRVYIVEDGDSLTDIARRELGNGSRAAEIQALNREVLGSTAFLRPGLELILPR
jgi:hypothetical protein